MQPILVPCEAPFRINCKKTLVQLGPWPSPDKFSGGHGPYRTSGPVGAMALIGPVVVQWGPVVQWEPWPSPDNCLQFLCAGAKKYKFSFLLCAGPLNKYIRPRCRCKGHDHVCLHGTTYRNYRRNEGRGRL